MEGQVREPQFLRSLVEMGQEKFTGAIRLENEDVIKIIYFQDGQIISASTNDPAESVDEILLRGKKVTREHIQQALVKRKQDETLGDALLTAGFISRKELRWARRHQIVEVLRSATGAYDWHYTVVPDYVSPRSSEGTNFQVEPLLIELVVTDPDRKHVDKRLDGGEVRLRKSPSFDDRYSGLGLNEDADRVAELVDGRRTATEIAAEAGGNGFMNLKLLAALRVLGVLEINPKAQEQLEISFQEGAAPSGLLPGIEPEQPINVPEWEVESVPGIDLSAPEPSVDWPDPSEDQPSEELELGPIVERGQEINLEPAISEPATPNWDVPEDDGLAVDLPEPVASTEPEAWELESVATDPVDDSGRDASLAPSGGIEEEVERALEWSPPISETRDDVMTSPADDGIDRTDESWLPTEEQEHVVAERTAEPQEPTRKRWIPIAIVLLIIAALAVGWFWMRGAGEDREEDVVEAASEPRAEDEPPVAEAAPVVETEPEPEPVAESTSGDATPVEEEPETTAPAQVAQAPAPSQPAAGGTDALRAEYDRQAREYAEAASTVPYTIQFELVCQTASVTLAINEGGSSVWFVPIDYQGRPCYRVFWGRYQSEAAARAAQGQIPSSLGGSRPVIVQPGRVVP